MKNIIQQCYFPCSSWSFMTLDLKDHFLASPMPQPEFMKIPTKYIPPDMFSKYKLESKITNGFVYCKIKKGMYGSKQATLLAYNFLKQNLEPHGFFPIPHTTGLWKHKHRKIVFCLCVDDSEVKYYKKLDAQHLIETLQKFCKVSIDWIGSHYCGFTLTWNESVGFVD